MIRMIAACSLVALHLTTRVIAAELPVDNQIASYLSNIEATLSDNDAVSFGDLSSILVSIGGLLPNASAMTRQLVQDFPTRLRRHASQNQTSIRMINLSVFADVASPFIEKAIQTPAKSEIDSPAAPPVAPQFVTAPVTTIIITAQSMNQRLLERGDSMLSLGDISAARLLYRRAADSNDGIAALKLGDTYDAEFLAAHRVIGLRPDQAVADQWYRKAEALGIPQATQRLRRSLFVARQ